MRKLVGVVIAALAFAGCGNAVTQEGPEGNFEEYKERAATDCSATGQHFVKAQNLVQGAYSASGTEAVLPSPAYVDTSCGGVSLNTAHMSLPQVSGYNHWVEIGPYTFQPYKVCIFTEWAVHGYGSSFKQFCPPDIPIINGARRKYRVVNNAGIWRMQADLNADGVWEGYDTVPGDTQPTGQPETEVEFFANSHTWPIDQTHDNLRYRNLPGNNFQLWADLTCQFDSAWNWEVVKLSQNSWKEQQEIPGRSGC